MRVEHGHERLPLIAFVHDVEHVAGVAPEPVEAGATNSSLTHTGTALAGQYGNIGTASTTYAGQPVSDTNPDHYFGDSAQGQITPTQVSCQDFISGTAPTLGQVNYSVDNGKIGQGINPGVFFFYTKITTTVPNQVVTVSQTNTSTNNAAKFLVHQGQARLYTGNCSSWKEGTLLAGGAGASFTVATPGNYVLSLKYDTKSIAGTTAPVPANIRYDFTTSLGGTTGGSVLLVKQP